MNKIFRGSGWGGTGFLFVLLAGLISAPAQTNFNRAVVTRRPPAPRRASIVLILADNIGYGDLGCYGQTKVRTPNLDKLASEGIRFTSYYAGSPQDQASRASLFTGLEPRHVGASFGHPLPMDAVTIPMVLKGVGYNTGLMGEWNLGDTPPVEPNTKGFDEFAGFLSQNHARDYFSDTVYRQETATGSNTLDLISENVNNAHGVYLPNALGEFAVRFISINVPDQFNHYRASFLCIAYPTPHNGMTPKKSPYESEPWPQAEKNRATMIAHMDNNIGMVMAALAHWRMDTNTIVIFTSIGGPQQEGAMDPKFFGSSGPLRGQAGSVYEGGIRVPMIVRWPARIKPGQVSDFPWAAWDLLPTLTEVALMKPPKGIDGISILPVLTGKGKTKTHESFYWESHDNGGLQQAVRMGNWKLVRLGTNTPPALYNLKTDVGEKNDVAEKNPDVVKKLKGLLEAAAK
ncbi:MAG TPA: sulfatase-like hydrolase/transferase [Candidatus Angelobacter sp.]|nr:sulfatase-like hydrolase/transferase [Candidatus Angelobacter sp.]